MAFKIKEHKDKFLFIPLGGSGEIGMNLNVYHYQGKFLIVDMGVGFADEDLPGINLIVPDISFLIKHKKDIVGLFITHIHEDHIGAVQYLWDELRCPIFTTQFTAQFLKAKLAGMDLLKYINVNVVEAGSSFSLEPFNIRLVPLTHSAPEMQALVIKTEEGSVFHTGDWKLDPDPVVGNPVNKDLLRQIGDEGLLAVVGDSTNVFSEGRSGSEGALQSSLTDLISSCPKMVAVTTFASNVARMKTIIDAAHKCGRKVILAGKSLWRVANVARDTGYFADLKEQLLSESEFNNYPREQLLVLCTGCQGEELAATNKIAHNDHPHIRFEQGDTIIFSSKIIPGNEITIYKLFNRFLKLRVEVFTERDHFVHVSGHPAREELRELYELLRPKYAIPVHGELLHLHEHVNFAKSVGVPKAIQIENGNVLQLANNNSVAIIGKVHSGYLAIDGNYLLPIDSPIIAMRRKMQKDGLVFVTLTLSRDGRLISDPYIYTPGVLDEAEDQQLISNLLEKVRSVVDNKGPKKQFNQQSDVIRKKVESIIATTMRNTTGKNPVIEVNISIAHV